MNKPTRSLLLLAVGALGMLACARYEEGPEISFFQVEYRVENTWNWAYAFRDGVNLTGVLSDSTITFLATDTVKICGPDGGCRVGRWNLVDKKRKLQIIFGTEAIAYDIRLLTRKDLWLRYEDTILIDWELRAEP